MHLIKLKLINFRQFYGEQTIEFSQNDERNVTLIHAENGVGKTTLLNAILWCYFENLTDDFERPKELICNEAIANGKKSCQVEVDFHYDENEYKAQRTYDGTKSTFKVFSIQNHNYKEVPNAKGFINSILPKDMAPYFFFQGEGLSSISNQGSSGAKFREAIRNILGFTFAESAISDLQEIKRKYGKKAGQLADDNEQLRKAAERLSKLEEEVSTVNQNIKNKVADIEEYEEKLEDVESRLSQSGNANVSQIQSTLSSTESRIKAIKRKIKSYELERQSLIDNFGWTTFGSDLATKALDFIDEEALKGRIPKEFQDSMVRDLLETAECICGRSLPEGTPERNQIMALLENASTGAMNERLMKARSIAANMTGHTTEFVDEVERIEGERETLNKELGKEEAQYKEFDEKLNGINQAEIKRLTEARSSYKSKLDGYKYAKGRLEGDLEQVNHEIATYKRKLETHGSSNKQLQRILDSQKILDSMISRCETKLADFEIQARATIVAKVNDILKQFSRKDYSIKVDNNFTFHLVRLNGEIVAKSKGENLLLNLSFVSALIDLARKREADAGDFLVQGTVAPFVIDAPFGELDETYKKATCEFLPKTSKQLILLLSSSHWQGTVDDTIKDRIGSEYILVSEKRVEQGSKPQDKIKVGKKEYSQSVYSQDRDATSVLRIM